MESQIDYDYMELLDKLIEKRGSTRESAYQDIIKGLSFNYRYDFVSQNKLGLLEAIKKEFEKRISIRS